MKTINKHQFITAFIMLALCSCVQKNAGEGDLTGKDSTNNNSASINNSTTSVPAQTSPEDCKKLDGCLFQYKYDKESSDDLTFTIVLNCKNDTLQGLMFGPDPQGEEGTYFFKSDLETLRLSNDSISFHLSYYDLYQKPFTLENYNKDFPNKILGGDNGIMYYTGKLSGDSIVLNCAGQFSDLCYDSVMVFKKK